MTCMQAFIFSKSSNIPFVRELRIIDQFISAVLIHMVLHFPCNIGVIMKFSVYFLI